MQRNPMIALATALLIAAALAAGRAHALAGDELGAEFGVNTTVAGAQQRPDIAMAADGRFVVVWDGAGPGDADGVFFQLYDAGGAPIGGETAVDTDPTGLQSEAAVAMAADGSFVVTWQQDTGSVEVRQFAPDGTPARAVIVVSTAGAVTPDVASDAGGNFVVVWALTAGDVEAQRYDSNGGEQGIFTVNDTAGGASQPAVAMNGSSLVVAWVQQQIPIGSDILYEINPAAGVANAQAANDGNGVDGRPRSNPAAAMDAVGNFTVAWDGFSAAGNDPTSTLMRRFQADGTPFDAGEVLVSTPDPSTDQILPAVAMHANGDLVVSWTTLGIDDFDIVFQRFAASDLSRQGTESAAHAVNTNNQTASAVAADAAGDSFAIAWNDDASDTNLNGAFAHRFEGPAGGVPDPGGLVLQAAAEGKAALGPPALAVAALATWLGMRRRRRRVESAARDGSADTR